MKRKIPVHVWEGCYDKALKGFIVPEAFSHPAKYSLGLIERIFDYCLQQGYLKRGDTVGDCFGGVTIGGLVAAYRGLRWKGVELEGKFVGFCRANINLHRAKFDYLGLPIPEIIQGDSRQFHKLICPPDAIVSSPPYADTTRGNNACGIDWEKAAPRLKTSGKHQAPGASASTEYGDSPGQIGSLKSGEVEAVISSPPFTQTPGGAKGINVEGYTGRPDIKPDFLGSRTYQGQGGDRAEGNIETLKPGDVQAVISSPPYAVISAGAGGLNTKPATKPGQQSGRKASAASQDTDQKYGQTNGQIAQLKGGSVEAVVSSPPYSETLRHGGGPDTDRDKTRGGGSLLGIKEGYPESPGQIGALKSGDVQAVVTSPPWENNSEGSRKGKKFKDPEAILKCNRGNGASDAAVLAQAARDEQKTYGDSPGQIGKEKGETYWEAMNAVYRSCFEAIKPGGYIVLVVKDYVKEKKRVPLCDDTCRLLEHIGFEMVERIHAMLVKETRETNLDGSETVTTKSRKSFFRRLAESKGSPKIDFEEVLIARKPL